TPLPAFTGWALMTQCSVSAAELALARSFSRAASRIPQQVSSSVAKMLLRLPLPWPNENANPPVHGIARRSSQKNPLVGAAGNLGDLLGLQALLLQNCPHPVRHVRAG